ncbi:putative flavohemoglobin [Aulographum hederae CBS 113979]|uniref:nitric oxide dioxygenase n=1 Tax=Aulographum hederae CBS 113979 TaxID=1176131 RepID=A0A6G1GTF4_9PEZI|nr:putative flavohemoglobin [Aulographum hederae CBS 113979]
MATSQHHQPLTPSQVKIVKSTAPLLAEHGVAITTLFYGNMLRCEPHLNNIFNTAHQVTGHQPRALAASLHAYALHMDDLGALTPALELICHKHASIYLQPEHYDYVGHYLLAGMKEYLGDACTDDVLEAWTNAYWALADIMIGKEKVLYAQAKVSVDPTSAPWTDWRNFRIARKVRESSEITSFYLSPTDESMIPLPLFEPGQYISIQLNAPKFGYLQTRQYSLSSAPQTKGDFYRISVKREHGATPAHPGYISNILHEEKEVGDVVQVSHPWGDFYLEHAMEEGYRHGPIVLVSAGVGLTCLMAMLEAVVGKGVTSPVTFVHGSRSKGARAFQEQLRDISEQHSNVKTILFTKDVDIESEKEGTDYDFIGRVDVKKLDKEKDLYVGDASARYFVCGPEGFMKEVEETLRGMGVQGSQVRCEVFGSGGVALGASA